MTHTHSLTHTRSHTLSHTLTAAHTAHGCRPQEQERAFLLLRAEALEAPPPAFLDGGGFPPPASAASAASGGLPPPSSSSALPGPAPGAEAGPPDSDAGLAERLQREEQAAFTRRMLALAGVSGEYEDVLEADAEAEARTDGLSYEELTALGEVAGTVSKGAAAAAVARLRATTYGALRPGAPGGDPREGEEQCAICRMEFEPEDTLLVLPCGHHYHSACIRRWLEDQKTCPHCGAELEA